MIVQELNSLGGGLRFLSSLVVYHILFEHTIIFWRPISLGSFMLGANLMGLIW